MSRGSSCSRARPFHACVVCSLRLELTLGAVEDVDLICVGAVAKIGLILHYNMTWVGLAQFSLLFVMLLSHWNLCNSHNVRSLVPFLQRARAKVTEPPPPAR